MENMKRDSIAHARRLRREMTDAERVLWRYLRNRGIAGLKFRRQVPVGDYIVDFLCHEKKLIIEVDGGQHAVRQDYDRQRTAWLEKQGFTVIRFWNHEVLENVEGVVERILEFVNLHPGPLPQAGEGVGDLGGHN